MEFSLLKSYPEMDVLAGEWNALLDESASHVPFLRHEYQANWWQTRGGGEWPSAELAVVVARENGRLVGIAPMFFDHNREGDPALLLLGSIEISDYLDVIARPADLPGFLHGLMEFLNGLEAPAWKTLDWYNLLEGSATLPALESAALKRGWSYQVETLQHSPFIQLPGDWETYLASIDKKQRHEVRRKMRRLEEAAVPSRWYFARDPETIQADADAFIDMMAQDPEKEAFLSDAMRENMRRTIVCALEADCLNLAFLEIDGKKAAGYLSFDYLNRLWVYNSGLDRSFMEYSPGWVLLGYLLQWANEQKRLEFDFMRGDEEYKYRFGATDRFVKRAVIRRG